MSTGKMDLPSDSTIVGTSQWKRRGATQVGGGLAVGVKVTNCSAPWYSNSTARLCSAITCCSAVTFFTPGWEKNCGRRENGVSVTPHPLNPTALLQLAALQRRLVDKQMGAGRQL